MKLLERVKGLFAKEEQPDECLASRRRFLKGAAGLAAVAVVASAGGMRLLSEDEVDRLKQMVKSGRVVGQTFYLDRTAVLVGLHNVTFVDCSFVASPDFRGRSLLEFSHCSGVYMRDCRLDAGKAFSAVQYDAIPSKFALNC